MQPPPPGSGRFPGQPHSETVGPNHPIFDANHPHSKPPGIGLPPGSVPPGASFDPIGPPGANQFGPQPDHLPPPQ